MGMGKMVVYVLQGHELQNDVQTMIQVFLPNSRYSRREEPAAEGLSVVSRMEKGIASAMGKKHWIGQWNIRRTVWTKRSRSAL